MKFVTTKAEYQWTHGGYVLVDCEGYWYDGEWAMADFGAPSPPPPPDPRELSQLDAEFNRINQNTPFGSLTFSGPNRNQADLTFSPEVQAITDQRLQSDSALLSQALQRQGLLNPNPIDLSQFGPIQQNIDPTGIDFSGPDFAGLPGLNEPDFQGIGSGPNLQTGLQSFAAPTAPDLQGQVTSPFEIQNAVDLGLNTSRLPSIPQDIGQFRNDVTNSVFTRGKGLLDEVFGDQDRRRVQELANRGLPEFGEASDKSFDRFNRNRNEAFTNLALDAVTRGGAEASRSLGDLLAARGQGFGEQVTGAGLNLQEGLFGNQAAGQDFGQALAQGQFGNQAQLGQFGAGLQGAGFNFGQGLSSGQFGNQSQQQQFTNQLAGTGFNNQTGLLGLGAQQGIRGQLGQEELARSAGANQASAQNAGLAQQLLQNANAARVQGLSEAQGVRGNQFNELQALLGGQQVQQPGLSNFFGPGNVNTLGANALNQQAQQNAFLADQSQSNALMSGLFGLGGSLLGGPVGGAALGNLFPSIFGTT